MSFLSVFSGLQDFFVGSFKVFEVFGSWLGLGLGVLGLGLDNLIFLAFLFSEVYSLTSLSWQLLLPQIYAFLCDGYLYRSVTWLLMFENVLAPLVFNCLKVFITPRLFACSYCLLSWCEWIWAFWLFLSTSFSYCFNWSHFVTTLSSRGNLFLFWLNIVKLKANTKIRSEMFCNSLCTLWLVHRVLSALRGICRQCAQF